MNWIAAVDGLLWLANLIIIVSLARAVYQQRKGAVERLILGIAFSASLSCVRYILENAFKMIEATSFPLAQASLSNVVHALWPIDIAALVILASFSLHFTFVFPRHSSLLRRWPRSPYLVHALALALAGMILTRLWLPEDVYRTFWRLGNFKDVAPQLTFAVVILSLSVWRWIHVLLTTQNTLVRRRMKGLLAGGAVATFIAFAIDLLPNTLGLPGIAIDVPGLRQLPTLISCSVLVWTIQRHQILNMQRVLRHSLVYTVLSTTLTLLYLFVTFMAMMLLQQGIGGLGMLAAPLLGAFVMAAAAIPLRDTIQRLIDRLFYGYVYDYRQILREHSRQLTALMPPTRLMNQILNHVETYLHPRGAIIVLQENETFAVQAARGYTADIEIGTPLTLPASILDRLQNESEPISLQPDVGSLESMMNETPSWPSDLQGLSLIVPFTARERLMGWMGLWPRQNEAPYTLHQRQFLATLANQSCVALQNAKLYEQMQRKTSELTVLNAVSTAITCSLDVDEVLQTIVSSVNSVIGSQKMAIYIVDETRQTVDLALGDGLSGDFVKVSRAMPLGEGPRTTTIVSGQPLTAPDIQDTPGFSSIRNLMSREGIRAMAEVPLWGKRDTIGSLAVYYTEPHHFTGDEIELLTILASQAAIALENARLYDMTDQALAQRVEELSAILNSVHEGILMLDMQGRILIANPTVERLLEIPAFQLVERTLPEVVGQHQLRGDQHSDLLKAWQLPAGLEDDDRETQRPFKDIVELVYPRQRILERVFAPVKDRIGAPLGHVVVLRDITEEKALERMREDLSDMIVHDLRTPLASIISGSTLLGQMIHEQDSEEETTPLLRIITNSSRRMLDLVNSLLDVSRMEAGKITLDAEPFNLLTTVERAVARLQSLSTSYQVQVEIAISPDFPAVWGDQEKIGRVLINLLDNAIKFTPAGGTVRISAQVDKHDAEPDGDWAICSILDSGPGIPPEHRDRIFDKFTQLPSAHTQKDSAQRIRGSGIGLNFCKLTIEAHGGRIWVEAGPDNQGSLFKFTLPLADEIEYDLTTDTEADAAASAAVKGEQVDHL